MLDWVLNMPLDKYFHQNAENSERVGVKFQYKVTEAAQHQRRRSGVFIVNFEHISHFFLVFLLFPLNKQMLAGIKTHNIGNSIGARKGGQSE